MVGWMDGFLNLGLMHVLRVVISLHPLVNYQPQCDKKHTVVLHKMDIQVSTYPPGCLRKDKVTPMSFQAPLDAGTTQDHPFRAIGTLTAGGWS